MGACSQKFKPRRGICDLQLCLLLICAVQPGDSDAPIPTDGSALLAFQRSADPDNLLSKSWISSVNYCRWRGVTNCTADGRVTKLVLRDAGLSGSIAPYTLSKLDKLIVLDLKGNKLKGYIPGDLSKLQFLQRIYLRDNQLSGPLPDFLGSLKRLRVLDISGNQLSSSIPVSLLEHARIRILYLQNNLLTGTIPDIPNERMSIVRFNVSNNKLHGEIPPSMAEWTEASFIGNPGLCGKPLEIHCSQHKDNKRLRAAQITIILVGVFMGLGLLIFLAVAVRKMFKHSLAVSDQSTAELEYQCKEKKVTVALYPTEQQMSPADEHHKTTLVFLEEDQKKYELDSLLCASAEILGRGILGTTYKAAVASGIAVAVKRLRNVIQEKKDFEEQMSIIGSLKHPNFLPLRAYYYSLDEKLLMYDYQANRSLFIHLHGKDNLGWKPLDWSSRIKIAHGMATGLAHLHEKFHEHNAPHGNIKSSNILLDENLDARISEFGLAPLIRNTAAESYLSGYNAPECKHSKMLTQSADIYNFGVVLLELLTGKLPSQSFTSGQVIDLPEWVSSVVRQEWTTEIFDKCIVLESATEERLVLLLKVAMTCVSPSPEQRPTMRQVVTQIVEQLNVTVDEPAVSDIVTTLSDYSDAPSEEHLSD